MLTSIKVTLLLSLVLFAPVISEKKIEMWKANRRKWQRTQNDEWWQSLVQVS